MLEGTCIIVALLRPTSILGSPRLVEVAWLATLKGPIRAFGFARLGAAARLGAGAAAATAAAVASWAAFLVVCLSVRAFVGVMALLLALIASYVRQILLVC